MMPKRCVYLDNNATTFLHDEVKKEMSKAMDIFGNPSSLHYMGRESKSHIESSREIIAKSINAMPEEIIFASNGSEANNTILNIFTSKNEKIITSSIEHPSIFDTLNNYNKKTNNCFFCPVDKNGLIDICELEKLLKNNKISLVSIMMANNEIGTIQNIEKITHITHQYGAYVHTDAVQSFGKIPVDVKNLNVDYLTISSHKIYGPKGIAAIYIKNSSPFIPFITGGHQEENRRAGTENILGIIGFSKACEIASNTISKNYSTYLSLKLLLKEKIKENIKDVHFNADITNSLPNTLNVSFEGVEGESILLYLDNENIYVSTGSACSSRTLDISHVLKAIGLSHNLAHGSIRFSIGINTTKEDIDYVIHHLINVIAKLRKMSTVYSEV